MSGLPPAVANGLRLRCPECRRESLFRGLFRMRAVCPGCGYLIEREPGYFIGAIYINYAATIALCLGGFFILDWLASPSLAVHLIVWPAVAVIFPLLFFRYSKSLWLNVDHFISPPPASRRTDRGSAA